uniref:Contactin-2 isoform X2 n=1 Tax=Geotrypetes seraphini TaxID=260995 RepID=A0A6P8NRP7_GEOSA|nr:contactin-2 isoform X2 [Geotrypetes seraphini]
MSSHCLLPTEERCVAGPRFPFTFPERPVTLFRMGLPLACLLFSSAVFSMSVWCPIECTTSNYGPVFEEQPANTLFPEGSKEERASFSCRARANPPATYRWKMNGTDLKIEADPRYSLIAGNLVINPVTAKDAGSYQCMVTNSVGSIVSKEAFFRFGFLQEFSSEQRDAIRMTEGWGVMIPCRPPPHYPGLSFRWFLNEFPNFIAADRRRFISQVTGNLYIARSQSTDQGTYSCFATSHMDFAIKSVFSTPTWLNVTAEDPRQYAPSIKARFPAESYVLTEQTVTLECFAFGKCATVCCSMEHRHAFPHHCPSFLSLPLSLSLLILSSPVPHIKWRKVDGPLPLKLTATEEPVLQIPNVAFEDEGTYECEAENAKGRDSFQGRVIVQAQPEWLKVISDTSADIGSRLHWSCAAAGKPRPTVRWLRNGRPLTSQDRIEVTNGELRIAKITAEDSGMYQCIAENKHGSVYTSAELMVQALAPDFRLNPVKRLIPAARGGEVLIQCQPRAAPKATVQWSKGTELQTNSSRVSITEEGMLIIRNISRSDEGKYTCFAENFMGKANSTGILSVREATKITLAPTSADINISANLTLQCQASHDLSMDLTFTWALNGLLIDFDKEEGHYLRASVKEAVGDLTIIRAQLRHAGRYTCTAQTVVDSTSASATVVVRGPPGPPGGVVVRDIKDTTVQLSWSRGFDNHSPIAKYTIQARNLLSGTWRQTRTNPATVEGNAESVQVMNLIPWMDYEFRVLATNILGTGDPSAPSSKIRTKEAAPTVAPAGLSGGGGAPNELIITWTPMIREYHNGEGLGYLLAFRWMGTKIWRMERVGGAQSSHFVYFNKTIAPYTPFEVQIKAFNQKGEGPFSLVSVVHSAEEEPHLAPFHISATVLSASEMQVAWNAVQQQDLNGVLLGYEIRYWRAGDKEAAADRVRTPGLDMSAHVTGLNPDTTYYVAVRAYNRAGTGPPSPTTNVTTTKSPPNRPPGNISWKLAGSTIGIKWDPVVALVNESSVTGYKMLYHLDSQVTPTLYLTSKTQIEFPIPEDATHAVVRIRATGLGGDGVPAEIHIARDTGTSMMVENSSPRLEADTITMALLTLICYLTL